MTRKSKRALLLERLEGKILISDEFHKNTNNRLMSAALPKTIPESWTKIHFKIYPRLPKIDLQKPLVKKQGSLAHIILKRRSRRVFLALDISKKELSYLLFFSAGLINLGDNIDSSKRPYPSAGGRYPLEIYPLILHCQDLEKGLYHYNVREHTLEMLLKKNLGKWLIKLTGDLNSIADASIVFIVTGVLDRTRIKYGDRGYRYILIEAGHIAQNILLLATELNLISSPIGGFIDSSIVELLDIKLVKEVPLYMIAIGKNESKTI